MENTYILFVCYIEIINGDGGGGRLLPSSEKCEMIFNKIDRIMTMEAAFCIKQRLRVLQYEYGH